MNNNKVYKTDWLASKPVFYNEKTCKISHNVNDVIDLDDLEFHSEGFNNYLDFGYSVFGQTPIKNVKFLRHSSEVYKENGKLKIIEHPDPVEEWFRRNPNYTKEEDILELIKNKVQEWEKNHEGKIVVPTSGGFDSRLLNYFIKDKTRVKAYTYGVSPKQEDSFEAVYAKKLCEILNIKWRCLKLGEFHKYFNEWDELFGISTHAHGMYHVEFYNKIAEKEMPELFLSGIIGDGWSGKVKIDPIKSIDDVYFLGYTHGINADSCFSKISSCSKNKRKYYEVNKEKLKDDRIRVVESMRMKLTLLNYLINLPKKFNFKVWSPFLDIDIALGMLNLTPERRKNRQWQRDFFKKAGLNIEGMAFKNVSKKNTLNNQAMKKVSLRSLNKELLSELIEEDYIDWVNKNIKNNFLSDIWSASFKARYIGEGMKLLGLEDTKLKAYFAYLTLRPIENILYKKRINE
jgi:hypothetical protein